MTVTFLHPRTSLVFDADVDSNTTGEQCLAGLVEAKFIEPPSAEHPYSMVVARTSKQFLPTMRMEDVGAEPGERFAIQQMERGATS